MEEALAVELALHARKLEQRAELGRERERRLRVVERLDPEAVADEHELAPLAVEDREREHAVQLAQPLGSALLPEREHDLGVGVVGREDAPGPLEPLPQLRRVVDLAVEDDRRAPARRGHRLLAGLEVEDREPPGNERDVAVGDRAAPVGPAVVERGPEAFEQRVVVAPDDAGDAAHQALGATSSYSSPNRWASSSAPNSASASARHATPILPRSSSSSSTVRIPSASASASPSFAR